MQNPAHAASAAEDEAALLGGTNLPAEAVSSWVKARPNVEDKFERDAESFSRFWRMSAELRAKLPAKPSRNAAQTGAAGRILQVERQARERFLAAHVETVYRKLTNDCRSFVRAAKLVDDAAGLLPGLVPAADALRRESERALKDKEGIEVDQGLFFSHVLGHPTAGRHLCHAMLLPRPETSARLAHFGRRGVADLGAAAVQRMGKASVVEMRHPRFLNAIDDTTLDALEAAVELAILDPETGVAVLRGGLVEHPKYAGRRVFSAGINLTYLYQGKISDLFYINHIMGFENKIFRGLARPDLPPDETIGATMEKPWIAAVDSFAIGGGCQHLLVMDYVLAAADAYLTLPARKEGIIPGAANMRLPRFTGDRIARQAILSGRRLDCDSPEGRLVCDEIAPSGEMDAALTRVVDGLTSSGVVSAVANRRAFRVAQEPLDIFLRYLAVYAREQAYCHISPALVANLEQHWNAQSREPERDYRPR
jgi:(3,5-dihydroxyphenyl)acetyl-CoA 1,2-dioxygenase